MNWLLGSVLIRLEGRLSRKAGRDGLAGASPVPYGAGQAPALHPILGHY